jgi:hypothetical protein
MHTSALAELDVRSASILGIAWVNWFSDRLDSCSGLLIKPIKQKENIACNHASYSIGKDNTMNNEGKDTLIINGQAVRFKMVRNADGSTSLKRVKPKEGISQMNLTQNQRKAMTALIKSCLENMGGETLEDLKDDPFTWVEASDLVNAGWDQKAAEGTFGSLVAIDLIYEEGLNEYSLTSDWDLLAEFHA